MADLDIPTLSCHFSSARELCKNRTQFSFTISPKESMFQSRDNHNFIPCKLALTLSVLKRTFSCFSRKSDEKPLPSG